MNVQWKRFPDLSALNNDRQVNMLLKYLTLNYYKESHSYLSKKIIRENSSSLLNKLVFPL